jgi:hypothetical protein
MVVRGEDDHFALGVIVFALYQRTLWLSVLLRDCLLKARRTQAVPFRDRR